jgi:uncharacterized protein YndB with AHSA1/START domain
MLKPIVFGATIGAVGTAAAIGLRKWWSTWGVVPEEAAKSFPGDDIVSSGETLLTRGITIDAPPEAVWPWLVQMGYGRAGWYSYDPLDMIGRSSDAIMHEFQTIAAGDVVPTHPAGGFEVKAVDPGHALVLYLDSALVERQATATGGQPISASETPGLAASSRFLQTASPPDFAVTWAFVLERTGGGQTRLIERMRGRFGPDTVGSKALMPFMGFGVFVMMRKQMLGIRDRVERTTATTQSGPRPIQVFHREPDEVLPAAMEVTA